MVVQSDAQLPRSTVLIAPTSTRARPASFRPVIELDGQRTAVLVEQTGAVDISSLGKLVAHLDLEDQWSIDTALSTVLNLN